jgi:hypothetical protein
MQEVQESHWIRITINHYIHFVLVLRCMYLLFAIHQSLVTSPQRDLGVRLKA